MDELAKYFKTMNEKAEAVQNLLSSAEQLARGFEWQECIKTLIDALALCKRFETEEGS